MTVSMDLTIVHLFAQILVRNSWFEFFHTIEMFALIQIFQCNILGCEAKWFLILFDAFIDSCTIQRIEQAIGTMLLCLWCIRNRDGVLFGSKCELSAHSQNNEQSVYIANAHKSKPMRKMITIHGQINVYSVLQKTRWHVLNSRNSIGDNRI